MPAMIISRILGFKMWRNATFHAFHSLNEAFHATEFRFLRFFRKQLLKKHAQFNSKIILASWLQFFF